MRIYNEKSPAREIIKWYLIALVLVSIIASTVDGLIVMIFPQYPCSILAVITSIICLKLMNNRFKRSEVKYEGSLRGGRLGLGFALIAFYLVYLIAVSWKHLSIPSSDYVLLSFTTGIIEEIPFRLIPITIMMYAFRFDSRRYSLILLITGIIFSAAHAGNLFVGADTQATIVQLIATFGIGVLLAAVYLRSGNGWPLIICHFLNNLAACMTTTGEKYGVITTAFSLKDTIIAVAMAVVCVVAGFYYIRKAKRPDIIEIWKSKFNIEYGN